LDLIRSAHFGIWLSAFLTFPLVSFLGACIALFMIWILRSLIHTAVILLFAVGITNSARAASKPHIVSFGKWVSVAFYPSADKAASAKVRPLLVDGRVKEFTLGSPHEVTDRGFVVRRAFRVNDSLPQENGAPHWQWQRGGWLFVDRVTGHVSTMNLPEFDVLYSEASWYRDYAAYCGASEDGKKVLAVVAQIARRKPVLKQVLQGAMVKSAETDEAPVAACPTPIWQRAPCRVTFDAPASGKQTFAIRGHVVDLVTEDEDEEEGTK
jgi:hypothetical protein